MELTAWSRTSDYNVRVGFDGEIDLIQGSLTVARGEQALSILESVYGISLRGCSSRGEIYSKLERASCELVSLSTRGYQ